MTTTFIDSHTFTLGGRRFELYAVPGGEATDALVVWLPGERTVFVGNLLGPVFGHVPNLYTIRGDKIRSAQAFLHGVDRVIALEPEVLITGHDRFEGAQEVARTLRRVRDATAYLRDRTIEGMNAGRSVWELMEIVTLPDDLALPQLHGKVPWIVRAVFEEHTGWFRYESTTELYAVPPSAVWGDLVELAGGADPADRARPGAHRRRPSLGVVAPPRHRACSGLAVRPTRQAQSTAAAAESERQRELQRGSVAGAGDLRRRRRHC